VRRNKEKNESKIAYPFPFLSDETLLTRVTTFLQSTVIRLDILVFIEFQNMRYAVQITPFNPSCGPPYPVDTTPPKFADLSTSSNM
jgi:hypothetical protein